MSLSSRRCAANGSCSTATKIDPVFGGTQTPAAPPTNAAPMAAPTVRDLWVADLTAPLPALDLIIPGLQGIVGSVYAVAPPYWSCCWYVTAEREDEERDGYVQAENLGDAIDSAKAAVEEVMLSMLSAHAKAAFAKRLQTEAEARLASKRAEL